MPGTARVVLCISPDFHELLVCWIMGKLWEKQALDTIEEHEGITSSGCEGKRQLGSRTTKMHAVSFPKFCVIPTCFWKREIINKLVPEWYYQKTGASHVGLILVLAVWQVEVGYAFSSLALCTLGRRSLVFILNLFTWLHLPHQPRHTLSCPSVVLHCPISILTHFKNHLMALPPSDVHTSLKLSNAEIGGSPTHSSHAWEPHGISFHMSPYWRVS